MSEPTGVELDEYYDFVIGKDGDIGKSSEMDEVAKDISGIITRVLNQESFGSPLGATRREELESKVETAVEDYQWTVDARIRIRGVPSNDTLVVDMIVLTSIGLIDDSLEV